MAKKRKDLFTQGAELPAQMLDRTVVAGLKIKDALPQDNVFTKGKRYWHMLGPGLTTGASDDDPSGILTYSQAGARYGFNLLWFSVLAFPLMSVVQEMCARIGLVTGRGLAGNIRVHFNKKLLYMCTALLFIANTINIGADLGAMAKAMQLFNPSFNFGLMVVMFAVISLALQIFTPYARYARYLKWLALILLSYVLSTLMANLDWGEVLRTAALPQLTWDKDLLFIICAILGTTISPYLFFWQTSQEVEEQIEQGKVTLRQRQMATSSQDIKSMRIDVWSGMFLTILVMFFIIAACGALLHQNGITTITSAAQAAEALRPFAGDGAYVLFALGIIGTGLLAIPVLAGSTSYAVAESLRWKEGLHRKLNQAHAFYGMIIISMLVGLAINFIGIDPIQALLYSAVANGLIAPFILYFVVKMGSNKRVMGRWRNKPLSTAIGWGVIVLMSLSGVAAIWSLL